MIIEQSIPMFVLVDALSIFLVIFALRHMAIAKRFEGIADKGIMSLFMVGLMLIAFGSAANLIKLLNLHSYFLTNVSFQIFYIFAAIAFLTAVIKLRKS